MSFLQLKAVSIRCPTAILHDNKKISPETSAAHHYAQSMAKALAMTAVDVLHTPGTLAKVKDDLKATLEEESKFKFLPFPTNKQVQDVSESLVTIEMPSDLGLVGWAWRSY